MIIKNQSLKSFNTFGVNASSEAFIKLEDESQLTELIKNNSLAAKKVLVLGGGSNLLFVNDYKGVILHPVMDSISVESIENQVATLNCDAGVEWDSFVEYCVDRNFGGIENLSYIPGSVGAAPVQNIGAYGAEVKDCIENVRAVNLSNGEVRVFSNEECCFGYRTSIFKNDLAGRYLITSVRFKLIFNPTEFNLSYGRVGERIKSQGEPALRAIRDIIIQIRKEKLPEPDELGNAGSFFKNPVLEETLFNKIKNKYPKIPSYNTDTNHVKVPAGWLIEKCGWKGKRSGNTGVHVNQALVLVNYGGASGKEILDLSEEIISSVKDQFDITLEREVNVV